MRRLPGVFCFAYWTLKKKKKNWTTIAQTNTTRPQSLHHWRKSILFGRFFCMAACDACHPFVFVSICTYVCVCLIWFSMCYFPCVSVFMLFLFCFFVCFCLVFYFSSFQRKRKQKNCQRDVNEKRDVHTGTHVRSTRVYTNRNKHVETGRVFPIVVVVPLVLWRLCIERRSKLGNKRMGGFSLFLSFSTSPKDWQRWRVRDDLTATTLLTPQQATTSTLWDNTYTAVSYTNLLFLFYFFFVVDNLNANRNKTGRLFPIEKKKMYTSKYSTPPIS